jgi:hypothetical protein
MIKQSCLDTGPYSISSEMLSNYFQHFSSYLEETLDSIYMITYLASVACSPGLGSFNTLTIQPNTASF